jgi:hypothetical protein
VNEVVIHVKAENETASDLAGARREFDKFGKDVIKSTVSAGMSAGASFTKSLGSTVASTSGQLAPILGAVGIAAAPLIASSIAGAVIGGAGVGGVVGGLVVASKDARVQAATKTFSDDFGKRLEKGAGTFVAPTIKGIDTIKKSLDTVNIEGIFEDSAKFVEPLAQGIGDAIEGLGDGIEDLVDNAGPVIDTIADGIGDIGEAVGNGMSSLADNAESSAEALDDVFGAMEMITSTSFGTINALVEMNEQLNKFNLGTDSSGLAIMNDVMEENAGTLGHYVAGVEDGAEALTEFQKAADDLNDSLRAQTDPVFALMEAQDGLAESQKEVNKATKKFGKDSPEAEAALRKLAGNALDLQDAAGALGDEFDGNMTPALRATLKAAGATDATIGRLERQFKEAKREGDRFSKNYNANVKVRGADAAIGDLRVARQIANSLDGKVIDIAMRVTGVSNVSKAKHALQKQYAHGGIKGAADGGVKDGLTWVGEAGPELVDLSPGSRVLTTGDSMRMASGGGDGGGGHWVTVPLVIDGKTFVTATLPAFRDQARTRHGNSAERMFAG